MQKKATLYEESQLNLIKEWEANPPSQINRAVGFFSAPLVWAAQKVIPEDLMIQALKKAFETAEKLSESADILKESDKLGHHVSRVEELKAVPLDICDIIAENCSLWAKGLAGVEGAITGIAGIAGLAADIPGLLLLTLRSIKKIGHSYGFETSDEIETFFQINVFLAGSANTFEEKKRAISELMEKSIEGKKMSSFLGKETLNAAVRNLAKQLCINITHRKAAQTIPIIGCGVGAAMNTLFITDITSSAKRLYQKRRLLELF
ncbi:MAG: EcsC family protein [Candidatus Riflebacteria bacterium]|nr:EcsC family protein [Candidatus Riflebacteria bacterium]